MAEVLARKAAFGGGVGRLAAAAGGLLLFSITAIAGPYHPVSMIAAVAGIALLVALSVQARRTAPQPKFTNDTLQNGASDART